MSQAILDRVNLFVKKLYLMVEGGNGGCIGWNEDGSQLVISDEHGFENTVLPMVYGHANLSSFVRQLNFYSFAKVMVTDPVTKVSRTARRALFGSCVAGRRLMRRGPVCR